MARGFRIRAIATRRDLRVVRGSGRVRHGLRIVGYDPEQRAGC